MLVSHASNYVVGLPSVGFEVLAGINSLFNDFADIASLCVVQHLHHKVTGRMTVILNQHKDFSLSLFF